MTDPMLHSVTHQLLESEHLSRQQLESVLEATLVKQVDYADLFIQSCIEESWCLEDGIVKNGAFDVDSGFGLRVISGETAGFAYSNEISMPALKQAASTARSIARSTDSQLISVATSAALPVLYTDMDPIASIKDNDKIDLLRSIDALARASDQRVKQVFASYSAHFDTILVLNSTGEWMADKRPLISISIKVVVEQGGVREQGRASWGGRCDFSSVTQHEVVKKHVDKAVQQAITNLSAIPAPAGEMPVVLAPGWPAVLLHEAVGHGLEGDSNRKGSSAFSGMIGERVASSLCTIVDDGTLAGRRGSLTMDDEGVASQCTVLIEKGILKGYMFDRHNARLMGQQSTGNGRRESYQHMPIPRMTNTYLLPGDSEPEDIIASVTKGIYAVDFSGGQVDTTSGKFVFTTSEAYLIENGQITKPVKSATLIGNGPDVLTKVSMLGNDFALDEGLGVCGKAGQNVPVGVGQPTVKIDQMTVGGSD